MEQLPSDPMILLCWLNTKLRDDYDTPERLCDDLAINPAEFAAYIAARHISYFPEGHRFVTD